MALPILGIDVAKATSQVTLLVETHASHQAFPNVAAQFDELTQWLRQKGVPQVQACMEATGRYGEALATYLDAQGHIVSVVNPARIKDYARSQLRRNKTDRVDATVIAEFAQTQAPPRWVPPTPEISELQELLHQYDALQAARQQERNRLQAGLQSDRVRQLVTQHLAFLDAQLETLLQMINDLIDRHPDLKQHQVLLTSVPGIGPLTAAKLQAMDLPRFDSARAASAYAGLNPMQQTSGSSVHRRTRLSKVGHAELRRALYMPAVVAKRYNPIVQDLCVRLAEKGKPKMAVIGAAMHKLLCLASGVLKSGKPFDPNYAKSLS